MEEWSCPVSVDSLATHALEADESRYPKIADSIIGVRCRQTGQVAVTFSYVKRVSSA